MQDMPFLVQPVDRISATSAAATGADVSNYGAWWIPFADNE